MHILVTNDDGPPSPQSSPYVHCLIKHLQKAGHTVSVCLPHTQRSWIGKAHIIGQTLTPLYYRPSDKVHGDEAEGMTLKFPSKSGDVEEWVLIDGTPASCVQIGVHHFFQERGPIDLVVSGPNYGRNTTAVFAMSSGTLGAALEAAVCKYKAIALSFAFFSRNHDVDIIEEACRHSVRVIHALYKQWPTDGSVDLYSVNAPLAEGVEKNKTIWTNMLQNYWRKGSCFQAVEGDVADAAGEEEKIREGPGGEAVASAADGQKTGGHIHKHFKWAPSFQDVYESVQESSPGNDGWAIQEHQTSVTPLKANFAHGGGLEIQKELQLQGEDEEAPIPESLATRTRQEQGTASRVKAVVAYEDPYVQPLIMSALRSVIPETAIDITTDPDQANGIVSLANLGASLESRVLQITPYEQIDFEHAASHPETCLINSYMIRKALIRKHYLSVTLDHWIAKHPDSVLRQHVKRSEAFEVDYAEFLDDALIEAFDLRESLDRNAQMSELPDAKPSEQQWWILKPGMSDRGQGIRLFSTMEQLQAIFDGWEEDQPDSDLDEDEDNEDGGDDARTEGRESSDYITTSHLRHFVAQPYIHPPLLLEGDNRKFHIRTYVLCTGSLKVYVYKHMLALFAAKPYTAPWESPDDIESFLTNTCLQESPNENTVRRFWELNLPKGKLEGIYQQIQSVTGEIFEAAARAMALHFQTLPNAFEVYGLDFLVDARGDAWLLEVNAFPDFKQTGGELQDLVAGFWEGVMRCSVAPFFGLEKEALLESSRDETDMVCVKDIDLGRR